MSEVNIYKGISEKRKQQIKEILEKLNDKDWYEEFDLTGTKWIELKQEETNQLLDYITNLQEQLHQASLDIQELTERDIECPSWCDKLTNLDEKNKELKKKITFNEKSRRKMQQSLMEQIEYYKSRIEKAVEYIENTPLYETTYDYNTEEELEIQNVSDETASNTLLDILNGRSDE